MCRFCAYIHKILVFGAKSAPCEKYFCENVKYFSYFVDVLRNIIYNAITRRENAFWQNCLFSDSPNKCLLLKQASRSKRTGRLFFLVDFACKRLFCLLSQRIFLRRVECQHFHRSLCIDDVDRLARRAFDLKFKCALRHKFIHVDDFAQFVRAF